MALLLILSPVFLYGVFAASLNRRDLVITNSYKDATNGAQFGTQGTVTTLNQDVTVWLSGADPHNLNGNINIYGELILSQTDYTGNRGGMDSNYLGTNTQNGNLFIAPSGSISVNDWQASNDAGYIWHLYTFVNNGTLQWCGLGNAGSGSDYSLHCELSCYNYGLIDWGQYNGYLDDTAVEWENDNKQPPGQSSYNYLYNYGTFRLTNTVFRGRQNILGNGCWLLGLHGVLYLEDGAGYYQNPSSGPTYPNQNIYFSQNTAVLHLDSQTYSINPNFGPQLYGFGSGNAIEFEESIQSYTYSATTGILTVILSTSNRPVYIKLGLGYNPAQFSTARNPQSYNSAGFNAVFYSLSAPVQTIPTKCQAPAVATCTDPAATARRFGYFTSTSSTVQAATYVTTSQPYTGTGVITAPTTSTVAPSGTRPGTVVVYTPASYTTSTAIYTGPNTLTGPSTSTVPPSGTAPGTVVVYTPASYVTSTAVYTGPNTLTGPSTSTVPPSGTAPGTVVVYTPAAFVTTSQLYTGTGIITAPFTSTIAPVGTTPGTILVYTPASYITTTTLYTGSAASTSTVAPSGTAPGTVVVLLPASYITTTAAYTGPGTISAPFSATVQPSGTVPGTVIIYTPPATTSSSGTPSSTSTRPATVTTAIGPNSCYCTAI